MPVTLCSGTVVTTELMLRSCFLVIFSHREPGSRALARPWLRPLENNRLVQFAADDRELAGVHEHMVGVEQQERADRRREILPFGRRRLVEIHVAQLVDRRKGRPTNLVEEVQIALFRVEALGGIARRHGLAMLLL